jgi:hypothetical protein
MALRPRRTVQRTKGNLRRQARIGGDAVVDAVGQGLLHDAPVSLSHNSGEDRIVVEHCAVVRQRHPGSSRIPPRRPPSSRRASKKPSPRRKSTTPAEPVVTDFIPKCLTTITRSRASFRQPTAAAERAAAAVMYALHTWDQQRYAPGLHATLRALDAARDAIELSLPPPPR